MSVMNRLNVMRQLGQGARHAPLLPGRAQVQYGSAGGSMKFGLHISQATVRQVQDALRGLPSKLEVSVFRSAVRAASRAIQAAIKARVPVNKNPKTASMPHLRDTVVIKNRTYKSGKNGKIVYAAVGFGAGDWGGGRRTHGI